jgi:hypothetical protein
MRTCLASRSCSGSYSLSSRLRTHKPDSEACARRPKDPGPLTTRPARTYFWSAILPGDNGAMSRLHWLTTFVAVVTAIVLITADANARVGGGFSSGSRGMRTFSAPPSTTTAPTTAPIQRSMTQPSGSPPFGSASPSFFGGRGLFGGIGVAEGSPSSAEVGVAGLS